MRRVSAGGFNPSQIGYKPKPTNTSAPSNPRFNPSQVGYKLEGIRAHPHAPEPFQSLTGRLQTLQVTIAKKREPSFNPSQVGYKQARLNPTLVSSVDSFNPSQVGYKQISFSFYFEANECFNPSQVGYKRL